jgi:hypothetical protein
MKQNKLPIGNGKSVMVTDGNGRSREGVIMNQDNGYYLINFPGTIMNEWWGQEFVKLKE